MVFYTHTHTHKSAGTICSDERSVHVRERALRAKQAAIAISLVLMTTMMMMTMTMMTTMMMMRIMMEVTAKRERSCVFDPLRTVM